jgi:hypothetical protein
MTASFAATKAESATLSRLFWRVPRMRGYRRRALL